MQNEWESIHLIPPRPPFLVPLYSNFLFAGDIIQFNGELPKSPAAKTVYNVGGFVPVVLCSCATTSHQYTYLLINSRLTTFSSRVFGRSFIQRVKTYMSALIMH